MAARPGSAGKGHDFLRTIAGFTEANSKPSSANKPIKMGRVDYDYAATDFLGGVNPRVLFDGESTVSQKRYPVIVGYYPLPGQRVVLVPVGTTYLIIGTVDNTAPQDPDVQIFTATDTWEKPEGARYIKVEVQGAGGGGGGSDSTTSTQAAAGGGGGGGGYAWSQLSANSVDSSVTVTVGTGGGGGSSGNNGSNGGSSSFGSFVVAGGGGGGANGIAAASRRATAGGSGGTGTTGDLLIQGGDGFDGWVIGSEVTYSAGGGGSQLSNTRRGTAVSGSASSGTSGYLYGGGGGGAVSGQPGNGSGTSGASGGSGADGIVIVTTYF